jgi:hypothetical protein
MVKFREGLRWLDEKIELGDIDPLSLGTIIHFIVVCIF